MSTARENHTKKPHLVVFPNHLLAILGFATRALLLCQFVLAGLKLSLSLLPRASRHLMLGNIVNVGEQSLQVTYPALQRIDAAGVVVVVGEIRPLIELGFCVALTGLEGAVLLEWLRRGGCVIGSVCVLALL